MQLTFFIKCRRVLFDLTVWPLGLRIFSNQLPQCVIVKYLKSLSVIECPNTISQPFFVLLLSHPCPFGVVKHPISSRLPVFVNAHDLLCSIIMPARPLSIKTVFFKGALLYENHAFNELFLRPLF